MIRIQIVRFILIAVTTFFKAAVLLKTHTAHVTALFVTCDCVYGVEYCIDFQENLMSFGGHSNGDVFSFMVSVITTWWTHRIVRQLSLEIDRTEAIDLGKIY